jgi:2-amino-4-hydroxy-6-hydroxymethyldihydropteridine diphosphokinase
MSDANRDDLAQRRTFLGLGSNVGARERNILRAVERIGEAGGGEVRRVSSLYETEPVGCGPMRPFINAVVEVASPAAPEELLSRVQELESELGRRGGHNEPREIDIDIIAVGTIVLRTNNLTVPHPRYAQRRFVLEPLGEIAPDFVCPATGRSVGQLLRATAADDGVERISSRKTLEVMASQ